MCINSISDEVLQKHTRIEDVKGNGQLLVKYSNRKIAHLIDDSKRNPKNYH